MELVTVTVTGIDDDTDMGLVSELVEQCDFLELGVLLSQTRKGTPRYPSLNCLARLIERFGDSDLPASFAAHLCGPLSAMMLDQSGAMMYARDYLGGPPLMHLFTRFQLNGFSDRLGDHPNAYVNAAAARLRHVEGAIILPIPNERAMEQAQIPCLTNVHFLHDRSRGKGIAPKKWPEAGLPGFVGYAGGITPDNVRQVFDTLSGRPDNRKYWIDLESGARTEDRLDPIKVWNILRIAEGYVSANDS